MRTLLHSPFQAASPGSDRRMECETGARFPAAGPRGQRAGLCIAQYVHGCIGSPARDMPPLQSRPWITCSRLQGRSAHATSTSNLGSVPQNFTSRQLLPEDCRQARETKA